MAFNTGNPIGSKDVKDLFDNAENLDNAVNSTVDDTFVDRLGTTRKTYKKMQADADAIVAAVNDELTGATAEADRAKTEADRAKAEADSAAAVVTGGTATLTPEAGKIPLADGNGKIDSGWLKDNLPLTSSINWDRQSDVITRVGSVDGISSIHTAMRRCLVLDNGDVNYYLDKNDSTLKFDGTAADLTGTDGQVMVEIPKCYVQAVLVLGGASPIYRWSVSEVERQGHVLHPAFVKTGDLVYSAELGMWHYENITESFEYVYLSAYDACVQTGGGYIGGLNLDNNTANVDLGLDKLGSVSGQYPMVGLTRAEFTTLAENRGAGWEQLTIWVQSLVQILFITEYANLNTQAVLGNGNTEVATGYPTSSAVQADSPHSVAGKSNSFGNSSGSVTSTVRDTAWVSYRGIENWYGNCWNWCEGVNIIERVYYVKASGPYVDNTTTNYVELATAPTVDGYIRDVTQGSLAFIPSDSTGSSSTAFSDYYYQTTGARVLGVGGAANLGADAGGFSWSGSTSSASRSRSIGARLQFRK